MHGAAANLLNTRSGQMLGLLQEVRAFAGSDHNVLIEGETGVGKELVAHLLHQGHLRYADGEFVPVNCGAIPEGLFESLFFGHVRGAFSGAINAHKGYLEQAHEGTLFLDEVGELPLLQQVKLLRALETGLITRVGSETPMQVDFRLVAATNRQLRELVQAGTFRADLFYRLAVIQLEVPNLEERGNAEKLDIFKRLLAGTLGAQPDADAIEIPDWLADKVQDMYFPGNVRQLRNLAERVGVIVKQTGAWDECMIRRAIAQVEGCGGKHIENTKTQRDVAERTRIMSELGKNDWQRQKTAQQLGMSRKSLWEKMRKLDIHQN